LFGSVFGLTLEHIEHIAIAIRQFVSITVAPIQNCKNNKTQKTSFTTKVTGITIRFMIRTQNNCNLVCKECLNISILSTSYLM
jgi:hypothetical protein